MNEEMRKLVEAAENRASLTTGDRWSVDEQGTIVSVETERNYPVPLDRFKNKDFVAHAKQDVPALCAAVRELDAENEVLRAWKAYGLLLRQGRESGLDGKEYERWLDRLEAADKHLRELGEFPTEQPVEPKSKCPSCDGSGTRVEYLDGPNFPSFEPCPCGAVA